MRRRIRRTYGIPETHCSRCGKHFIVAPFHVYKRDTKYFCCYTCYNAYLNGIEAKKHQGKRKETSNG